MYKHTWIYRKGLFIQNIGNPKNSFVGPEFFNGWSSDDVSAAFWSNFAQYKEEEKESSWHMIRASMDWAKENDRRLYRKLRLAWDRYYYGEGFYKHSFRTPENDKVAFVLWITTIGAVIIISVALSKVL